MTADDDDKKRRLELTVNALQDRYGQLAIRHLKPQKQTIPYIATGFSPLDKALGIGGLPRGHITELVSIPSSGTATIALNVVAQAQVEGLAIYLDVDQNFDPPYAAQLGVDLERLVLIEPNSWQEACAIMRDFILQGHVSIFVFDVPAHLLWESHNTHTLSAALDRLVSPLSKTSCVLLFLITLMPDTSSPASNHVVHSALAHYASIRLLVYRIRWLYGRRDIRGYEAKVYIAKNKLAASAAPVNLTITLVGSEGDDR